MTKKNASNKGGTTHYEQVHIDILLLNNDFLNYTGHLQETTIIEKIIIYCSVVCFYYDIHFCFRYQVN